GLTGLSTTTLFANWLPSYQTTNSNGIPDPNGSFYWGFNQLLGLFYPGVTGIMAGSNRSEALRDTQRSIPTGTLAAIVSMTGLYVVSILLFGAVATRDLLVTDRLLTATIAWPVPAVVQVGIVLSTLGAALQNLMGAPRLLAAIANDNVLPVLNAFKAESHQEPHLATLFTLLLCCSGISAVSGTVGSALLVVLVAGSAAGAECVQGREPSGAASGHPLHTAPLLQVLLVVFLVVWPVVPAAAGALTRSRRAQSDDKERAKEGASEGDEPVVPAPARAPGGGVYEVEESTGEVDPAVAEEEEHSRGEDEDAHAGRQCMVGGEEQAVHGGRGRTGSAWWEGKNRQCMVGGEEQAVHGGRGRTGSAWWEGKNRQCMVGGEEQAVHGGRGRTGSAWWEGKNRQWERSKNRQWERSKNRQWERSKNRQWERSKNRQWERSKNRQWERRKNRLQPYSDSVIIMYLISCFFTLVCLTLAVLIYIYVSMVGKAGDWGDGVKSAYMQLALRSLHFLGVSQVHPKNWYPIPLILCKPWGLLSPDAPCHPRLGDFAKCMRKKGRGMSIFVSVLEGGYSTLAAEAGRSARVLLAYIDSNQCEGVAEVMVASTVRRGVGIALQSMGLAGLKPNIVCFRYPEAWQQQESSHIPETFVSLINDSNTAGKACVIVKGLDEWPAEGCGQYGTIDLFWIVRDGGIMLLLSQLLRSRPTFDACKIQVFCIAEDDGTAETLQLDVAQFLHDLRMQADVVVVTMRAWEDVVGDEDGPEAELARQGAMEAFTRVG
ncbi:unnamed protein product, partial [Closterium sp. Naga37s-1]